MLWHALMDPEPRALWPLGFLRAIEAGGSTDGPFGIFSLEQLVDADGNVPRFSDTEASDEDLGAIQALVTRWPAGLALGSPPTVYTLPLPEYQVDLEDPLGELQAILEGPDGNAASGSRVTIRLGLLQVGSAMWPTVWSGIVKTWGTPTTNVLRIVCKHDAGFLEGPLLKHRVRRGDFPYAHASALNELLPVILGTLDSRADEDPTGSVRCLYLDTRSSERLFVPQLGVASEIPRVWFGGSPAEEGTDYDLAVETIAGFAFRTIRWLSDPGDNPEVWCDLTGLEDVGDGTGNPIQTAALQLRYLLANFGFGNWRSGAWIDPSTVPLNLGSFEEADHFSQGNRLRPRGRANNWAQGRRTARIIDTAARAIDYCNTACKAAGWRPYWDEQGKLALAIIPDHRIQRTSFEGAHWIRDEDALAIKQVPNEQRPRNGFSDDPLAVGAAPSEEIASAWADQALLEVDLVPYETTDEPTPWTKVGTGDVHEEIDDRPYAPDDALTRATWDAASATGTFRVRTRWSAAPQVPAGHSIVAVEPRWRARYVANGGGTHTMKVGAYIGAAPYYLTAPYGERTLATSWTDYREPMLLNPATGLVWEMADLGPDLLELIVSATHVASQDKPEITQLFLRVYLVADGPAGELVRERLTRELLLASRPPLVTEAVVLLHRAAIAPGDPCSVSSVNVTAPGGEGWGLETWQRRPHVMAQRILDLNRKQATLRMLDARDLFVPIWESNGAVAIAPQAQGVARLGAWRAGRAGQPANRRFSRPTDSSGDPTGIVTMTGPNGDSVTIPADTERYSAGGLELAPSSGSGPAVSPDRAFVLWRHDAQPWPTEGGSAILLAQLAGTTFFRCGSFLLFIDGTTLTFRNTVNGTDYDATIELSGSGISTSMVVGIRWTPGTGGLVREDEDENEEDVPPYTLDLWVTNGIVALRATPVVSANPTPGDFELGDSGALDGTAILFRAWRLLLSDDEMVAEMEAVS